MSAYLSGDPAVRPRHPEAGEQADRYVIGNYYFKNIYYSNAIKLIPFQWPFSSLSTSSCPTLAGDMSLIALNQHLLQTMLDISYSYSNKLRFRFNALKSCFPIRKWKVGCPWAAHVLHMGCPLKQRAAQWTEAAHYLCKLSIISAHGKLSGQEAPTLTLRNYKGQLQDGFSSCLWIPIRKWKVGCTWAAHWSSG